MMSIDALSREQEMLYLAALAHLLTVCARDTYEIGSENILEPRVLRGYNELLHRVTGTVSSRLSGKDGYSLQAVIEMAESFGTKHNRVAEINWAIGYAKQLASKTG